MVTNCMSRIIGYNMLQTQQDKQVPAFSYKVFDRQLDNFAMMLKVLMDGWEDYSSQEMTFDIHSLCTKASRLCYLADQDLALQHTKRILPPSNSSSPPSLPNS